MDIYLKITSNPKRVLLEDKTMKQLQELTVNWHVTEACNFKCQYCFAKWDKPFHKELLHSKDDIKKLLDEILKLPTLLNQKEYQKFSSIRLNLVGGETFLYKTPILNIIKEAQERKITLSAITNGSTLDQELIDIIAQSFSTIGFSIDSLNDEINLKIGRASKGKVIHTEKIIDLINSIRTQNPMINIKINTVINELNYKESFHQFIQLTQPNKWKIFKMLPVITNELTINDEQFNFFIEHHQQFKNIISSENNNEMLHSYIMIDPLGRFFQNNQHICGGYLYSQPIYKYGIEYAFNEIMFNSAKYKHRYNKISTKIID